MGEQKRRTAAGHVPPAGMINASGPRLTALVRLVSNAMADAVDNDHLDVPVSAGCALAAVIDFLRANGGDAETRRFVSTVLDQRLSQPLAFWGVSTSSGSAPIEPLTGTRQ